MLKDAKGKLVIDPDWDEYMLDPRTPAQRSALAGVIGDWIAGCAAAGFDAVEIDNLDTFTRSDGLISEDDAVAQVRLFADAAHANGLAIAQKNSAEIVGRARRDGHGLRGRRGMRPLLRVRRLHGRLRRPRPGHRVPAPRLRQGLRRRTRTCRSSSATWTW